MMILMLDVDVVDVLYVYSVFGDVRALDVLIVHLKGYGFNFCFFKAKDAKKPKKKTKHVSPVFPLLSPPSPLLLLQSPNNKRGSSTCTRFTQRHRSSIHSC